jgi:hypothetical protein
VQCPAGTEVCVDGTCSKNCPPYDGCLPNGKAVQCWDGSCKNSSAVRFHVAFPVSHILGCLSFKRFL